MLAAWFSGIRDRWNRSANSAAMSVIGMAGILVLDGQLGPTSVTLRRAMAVTALVLIEAFWASRRVHARRVGAAAAAHLSAVATLMAIIAASDAARSLGWRLSRFAAFVAGIVVVARAPSTSVAIVGLVLALAVIEIVPGPRSTAAPFAAGFAPACLSYVTLRFTVDLIPQLGAVAGAAAWGASAYIDRVRGPGTRLSFTALGGPAIATSVFYLLWTWRRGGGVGNLIAALGIPLAWFALLPAVMPGASTGPLATFSCGSGLGLVCLAACVIVVALVANRLGAPPDALPTRARSLPLTVASIAAALAGICLVGTGLLGPVARRSIRVHNYGGLDWDRPVFGQFGAFSGGMFGLLPVYCRAEGYDFEVIEHAQEIRPASAARVPRGPGVEPPPDKAASKKSNASPPSPQKTALSQRAPAGSAEPAPAAGAKAGPNAAADPRQTRRALHGCDRARRPGRHPNPRAHQLAQGMERTRSPRRS